MKVNSLASYFISYILHYNFFNFIITGPLVLRTTYKYDMLLNDNQAQHSIFVHVLFFIIILTNESLIVINTCVHDAKQQINKEYNTTN